ncbi:MAG: DUF6285 domain-containing protein, partial [Tepidiformaceae bacterium]
TYDELLEAVASFLQNDVMPNTTGRINFHARVAANVVEMVRRELGTRERHLVDEWEGLDALLGEEPQPESLAALTERLHERNAALAVRIRDGFSDTGADRARLLAHLRQTTHDKLTVTNPAWAAEE